MKAGTSTPGEDRESGPITRSGICQRVDDLPQAGHSRREQVHTDNDGERRAIRPPCPVAVIDLTQSSACELCKVALTTGALFLDHREPLRPFPDCIPYCRSAVFGPKLHLVTANPLPFFGVPVGDNLRRYARSPAHKMDSAPPQGRK